MPNYVQIVNHSSSLIGGLILLPGSIIAAILNPWFGHLYDSKGAKLPLYTGTWICLVGCLLLTVFGLSLSTMMVVIFFALMMIGRQMAFNNTMAEGMKIQSDNLHTDATAVFETGQQYAGSIGTTVMATIISTWQKKQGSYAQLTAHGSRIAFLVLVVASVIILLCYWTMFKLERAANKD